MKGNVIKKDEGPIQKIRSGKNNSANTIENKSKR